MKRKEKIIGSAVILVLFTIFLFIGSKISNNKNNTSEDIFVESDSKSSKEKELVNNEKVAVSQIKVEIKGAVKNPDVYTLNKGSIVQDLVKVSGGYNEEADKDSIIQSQKLNDGECVWVKKKGEATATQTLNSGSSTVVQNTNGKININTATKEQLMKLDGIGESRAEKILEYREKNGPYKSIEDLRKIGARIGDAIINNIKDSVEIN